VNEDASQRRADLRRSLPLGDTGIDPTPDVAGADSVVDRAK
jgi:hypothetical protein